MTIESLTKSYAGREALRGLSLSLEAGRIYGLLGPNGAGKTTLLKTVAGLLQPDCGDIEYPGGMRRGVESKGVISFMPDRLALPGWMRVRDALGYWRAAFGDYSEARASAMLDMLELSPNDVVKKLSMGMLERLALALTFSRNARVYLLDEPLGGIDPIGKSKVLQAVIAMELDDAAVMMSTHLVKDVEAVLDGFFIISDGRIIFEGDCERIRAESSRTAEQVYLEVFANGVAV